MFCEMEVWCVHPTKVFTHRWNEIISKDGHFRFLLSRLVPSQTCAIQIQSSVHRRHNPIYKLISISQIAAIVILQSGQKRGSSSCSPQPHRQLQKDK